MQDEPGPVEILEAVAQLLRDDILPLLEGSSAFQVRVAANAIDLVRRQVEIPPRQDAAEAAALGELLAASGTVTELNAELARRIASRAIDLETPGLQSLLWSMTEAKLAVDQPNYAGLRRANALRAALQQES